MHKAALLRMQWFVDQFVTPMAARLDQRPLQVLDVGSYDVNGSHRAMFDASTFAYTGLDVSAGPNVDVVLESPYDWSALPTDSYHVVISGQALEHIEFFWETMAQMSRVLKHDGLLCVIVPRGFSEHRYPVDCYRFLTDGMAALARYCELDIVHAHSNAAPTPADIEWLSEKRADSMLVARKPYAGETRHPDLRTYQGKPLDHQVIGQGFFPVSTQATPAPAVEPTASGFQKRGGIGRCPEPNPLAGAPDRCTCGHEKRGAGRPFVIGFDTAQRQLRSGYLMVRSVSPLG